MASNSSESFQPLEGAIAIIGGGVAGVVAAQKLAEVQEAHGFAGDFRSKLKGRNKNTNFPLLLWELVDT